MISFSACLLSISRSGISYGGGHSTGSFIVSVSPHPALVCNLSVAWLLSGSDSFPALSVSTVTRGVLAFGGKGGALKGLMGDGVLCVCTTTGSGEGNEGVLVLRMQTSV